MYLPHTICAGYFSKMSSKTFPSISQQIYSKKLINFVIWNDMFTVQYNMDNMCSHWQEKFICNCLRKNNILYLVILGMHMSLLKNHRMNPQHQKWIIQLTLIPSSSHSFYDAGWVFTLICKGLTGLIGLFKTIFSK